MTTPDSPNCERCGKRPALCICQTIAPCRTKTKVLILQHPQEPKEDLSSAKIIELVLPNAAVRTGLSWPNLNAAAKSQEDNKRWGVLYLGTIKKSVAHLKAGKEVLFLIPKGTAPFLGTLDGILALDGNWQQAKTLWWRNPWLLKLNRIILSPKERSLYGKLRREPRVESLSTLEAVAFTLAVLEKNEQAKIALLKPFEALLEAYRKQRRS